MRLHNKIDHGIYGEFNCSIATYCKVMVVLEIMKLHWYKITDFTISIFFNISECFACEKVDHLIKNYIPHCTCSILNSKKTNLLRRNKHNTWVFPKECNLHCNLSFVNTIIIYSPWNMRIQAFA